MKWSSFFFVYSTELFRIFVPFVFSSEPPSIINSSGTPVVFTGDSLALECSARGYPQPVIRWYKNGSLIHENTSLEFSSLNEFDTGVYQCNASNIAGSDTYEVEVFVRGQTSTQHCLGHDFLYFKNSL